MVKKMMMMKNWRPWPPVSGKKFELEVKLVVRRLKGLCSMQSPEGGKPVEEGLKNLVVETKWRGPKSGGGLGSFGKRTKRDFTRDLGVGEDGVVEWNQEFQNVCNFVCHKESCCFQPWEVAFSVFNGLNRMPKNKATLVGNASLDLAQFASAAMEKEIEIQVQLAVPGKSLDCGPSLFLSLGLFELRASLEPGSVERSIVPSPLSPHSAYALKAGLRKVKMLTDFISNQTLKKACHVEKGIDDRRSSRSEDADCIFPFDVESLDDSDDGESEESKEDSGVWVSLSYETLAHANHAGRSLCSNVVTGGKNEDSTYYGNRKSDEECLLVEKPTAALGLNQPFELPSNRSILSWKKRKLSFRSPKAKGEPLLKKYYGEEGGDDIDFDRRQFSLSDESLFGWDKSANNSIGDRSPVSEFGDDNFAVGSWNMMEVISRDGHLKLQAQGFLASIDQRNARAAGESACTTLVAVLADWLQSNQDEMPIKSQFDSLIREGSSEWRKLCENDSYKEQFPDRHFDLETVLQAEIRPLSVVPEKSFVGFFHPEGMEGNFNFLQGAMSFDSIWDELSHCGSESLSNGDTFVYIVSWNDHFFVLKVDKDAYYIIDTLGERLYEGCNQAYILKFDKDTTMQQVLDRTQASDKKPTSVQTEKPKDASAQKEVITSPNKPGNRETIASEEAVLLCRGKETCKEYIKSFLAAIPVRELQADIKKGLMASTPLHHRLQIEFHYTQVSQPVADFFDGKNDD